jgi:hypothetical protein
MTIIQNKTEKPKTPENKNYCTSSGCCTADTGEYQSCTFHDGKDDGCKHEIISQSFYVYYSGYFTCNNKLALKAARSRGIK